MVLKRFVTAFLVGLLSTTQLLYPVSAYAETVLQEDASAVEPALTAAGSDEGREGSESDRSDAAAEADSKMSGNLDDIEYVYIDQNVVEVGKQQHIAVGFSSLGGNLVSAQLQLKTSDGQVLTFDATSVTEDAALFTMDFADASQALGYSVEQVSYRLQGSAEEHAIDLASDDASSSYAFDVVEAGTADAIEGSDDSGISAMVVNEDGELEAADSVEDAIAKADAQGVAESQGGADLLSQNVARSAVTGTREDYLVVAIDPGHGGYDPGSMANGVVEKDVNWSIANHFKDELTTYTGVTPYLTTWGDEPGLQTRVDRAVSVGADVFVSVHVNSASAGATGAEVWVPRNGSINNQVHTVGKALGEKIENQLAALGLYRRGVFTRDYPQGEGDPNDHYADGSVADYYSVIRNARKHGIPGIIVEHAFVTNPSDAAKLADDNFRRQLGIADATGVAQQYNLGKDAAARAVASVAVKAHVANIGWESTVYDNKVAGTTGKSFDLEALQVSLLNSVAQTGGVQVRARVQGDGWQGWVNGGDTAGTTGQGKAIEAVQMRLTGSAADSYDIWYRVHSADFGWLGWAKNGASAGSQGYGKGAQAVEVVVTPKGSGAPGSTSNAFKDQGNVETEPLTLSYRGHVSNIGWQAYVGDGQTAGTVGQSLPLEALQVEVDGGKLSGGVQASAHVANIGWQDYVNNGQVAGTTGRSLQVEAIRLRLTGELAQQYDIYYRVHAANIGWLGWAKDDAKAGTQGYGYAAEAVQVKLVKKGDQGSVPGSTSDTFRMSLVRYSAHVQNIGWQPFVSDGDQAGTTGRSLNLEALQVALEDGAGSGSIQVRAHVSNVGWQGWTTGVAGTTGRNTPVEAVQIKLTGAAADGYDVYYRVHSADFGWMDWAKNGESAGSAGYAKAAQAVQIKLVPKGEAAPGSTSIPYRDRDSEIMGATRASVAQMVKAYTASGRAYPSDVYAPKGAETLWRFCSIIDAEAKAEGVRAEIVFAQIMHETGYLQFGGSVKPEQCNFGGLGATSPTVGGATFENVETGIRAQVQHLKAYASTAPLNKECVDPRFSLVKRGIAPSLFELNGRWAVPGTNYGQNILKIVKTVLS